MSFIDKLSKAVNLPVVLQVIGIAICSITLWKGVHHFWPTTGVLTGVAMLYVGKHYARIYSPTPSS